MKSGGLWDNSVAEGVHQHPNPGMMMIDDHPHHNNQDDPWQFQIELRVLLEDECTDEEASEDFKQVVSSLSPEDIDKVDLKETRNDGDVEDDNAEWKNSLIVRS